VVAASDPERDEAALAAALVERGLDFWLELRDGEDRRADTVLELLLRWMGGERLTERADEPERRVRAAEQALAAFGDEVPSLHRYHAQAVLAMPAGEGDRAGAVAELRASLEAARAEGDADEAVRTIAALLDADTGDEALLDEGEAWAKEADEEGAEAFRIAAESFTVGRHITARDDDDPEGAERWAERHDRYVAAQDESLGAVASRAEQAEMAERYDEAADAYRTLVEATGLEDPSGQHMAVREGELRLMLGQLDRAVATLRQALPFVETRYLTSVTEEDVDDAQDRLNRAANALAAALARREDWEGALQALDRTHGLRGRYRAALRLDPAGDRILALERELDVALRGAIADEGEDIPARARLLEEYRQIRPRLAAERLAGPSLAEIRAALEASEAVAVVGFHFTGTIVVVITPAGVDAVLLEDFGARQWLELFAEGDDWLEALIEPGSGLEPEPGLSRVLAGVERVVGRLMRGAIDTHGLTRVTVVPAQMLHMIPWGAVPSLRDVDVVMAASVTEVVREPRPRPAPRSALVVANPTLDLRVSAAACGPVVERLAAFDVLELDGNAATEAALLNALKGRALLHFAGHGRSEALLSGLEVNPGREDDPFPDSAQLDWREQPAEEEPPWHERIADIPGGRLVERRWTRVDRLDRRLEYAGGTLVGTYAGDRLLRLAELWTASDLMITEGLGDCRVALLVACASGAGVGRSDEAKAGVPVALQLAGIDTVIGTLWEVDEAFAALWAESFYRGLAGERIDLAALVRRTNSELRDMSATVARERLLALADSTQDPFAVMELEAYAYRLPDPPFAEPAHWAAFYLIGRPTIEFAT
jgi:CHAT domain